MALRVCSVLSVLALYCFYYVNANTYSSLANFTGQFTLTVKYTNTSDKEVFNTRICNSPYPDAACAPPAMIPGDGDKLLVLWNLTTPKAAGNTSLLVANHGVPTTMVFKLCFSNVSRIDRKWRKFYDDIDLDRSCPVTIGEAPYAPSGNVTLDFDDESEIGLATWFVRVLTMCNGTGTACQSESTDKRTFILTDCDTGITPSLTGAIIACSILGPAALVSYMIIDYFIKKNK